MRRFLLGLLTLLAFCGPALAASDKPLVILAGKTQTIPSGDTLNLTLNPLTTNISGSTQCVQASSAGLLSGTGSACGTGTGTVTTTGSPASGNLTKFSGSTSITNGDLSGDCTTSATLATVCLKTNGVNFGTFATQNYATPPAIGGTTPAAGSFSTLSATGNLTTNVTGSTQCLHADTSGVVSGTSSDCASAGGGMTLLSTQAVSGTTTSTIVFSAISQSYKHLKIVIVAATDGTDNIINNVGMYLNADTTAAHYNSLIALFGNGSTVSSGTNAAGTFGTLTSNIPSASGSNALFGPIVIDVFGYSQTGFNVQILSNSGSPVMSRIGAFSATLWKPAALAAVTTVTLTALNTGPSTVHFQNGSTAYLYGY